MGRQRRHREGLQAGGLPLPAAWHSRTAGQGLRACARYQRPQRPLLFRAARLLIKCAAAVAAGRHVAATGPASPARHRAAPLSCRIAPDRGIWWPQNARKHCKRASRGEQVLPLAAAQPPYACAAALPAWCLACLQ